jgi:O-antigen ligase
MESQGKSFLGRPKHLRLIFIPLIFYTILLFCQLWFDISGFTIRTEDLVIITLLILIFLLPILTKGTIKIKKHPLNLPFVLWCAIIILGTTVTLSLPYNSNTQKDALVTGIRLILTIGAFFAIYNYPIKENLVSPTTIITIIGFSFITTFVSLLQIGYWDGWLSFSLPKILITFRQGANTAQGREVFGLFLGDSGSHKWSALLSIQALLMWLFFVKSKGIKKILSFIYFLILSYILIRISVRNSILGLFISIFCLAIFRDSKKYVLKTLCRVLIVSLLALGMLLLVMNLLPDNYYVVRIRQAIPKIENGKLIIDRGSNIYGRLDYGVAAIKMFLNSPLLGKGFNTYGELSTDYLSRFIVHAHNSYLSALAEFGFIGFFGVLFVLITIFRFLLKMKKHIMSDEDQLVWNLTMGAYIIFAFTAFFGNSIFLPEYVAFLTLLLGAFSNHYEEYIYD